jgi:gliding-associated putative ABC transporter substrate-binding component GldG
MTRKQAILLTALTTASLILALLISRKLWFRLDLTANRAFTISPVSRNLYAEISEQVRITYFISDKLRGIHPIPGEIEDLLREYAARSHGRITVSLKDPVKTNMTETVEQLGIKGQPLETVEQDQASVAMVYSGILIEYLDAVETLPLVFSLDTLEYDLTSRIRAMVRGSSREAGVLVGDADRQWEKDYGYLGQALVQAGYRVRPLNPGDEISPSLPVLIVLGGAAELDEWALYRIDHYIQNGGKVLFALESVAVDSAYSLAAQPIANSALLDMVSFYGATLQPALVLDVSCQTIPIETRGRGGYAQYQLINYPFWVAALAQFAAPGHPVSSAFAGVDLFWASPLELNPPQGVEGTALFSTTPEAWLQTRNFSLDPNQSYYFVMEQAETTGPRDLAAALSGRFPAWFAGVPKPVREGSDEELPDLPPHAEESRLVVIGDTDIATSAYIQAVRSQRNLDFLVKTLDWLGNDDDIIAIRNRESAAGRLDRIAEPVERAKRMALVRIINIAIVPALVIALGVFVNVRRRRLFLGGTHHHDA